MRVISLCCCVLLHASCMSGGAHRDSVASGEGNRMTVGVVQRQVSVGMPGSAVLEALGSPNIVSTDEKRREVWVYDKISTERAYSSDAGGASLVFVGYRRSAGASSTSQRTLTVIIKFDENGTVRDFAYHTSRF